MWPLKQNLLKANVKVGNFDGKRYLSRPIGGIFCPFYKEQWLRPPYRTPPRALVEARASEQLCSFTVNLPLLINLIPQNRGILVDSQ